MFSPTTCEDSRSATSSPASASGATRYVAPDGPIQDLFGRVPVRANLSARQAKELGLLTSGTCGLRGSISFVSASLQRSLESRLQVLLVGLILFTVTWNPWTTPSGVSRSRPRARMLPTLETGFSFWPTPQASDLPTGRGYQRSGSSWSPMSTGLVGAASYPGFVRTDLLARLSPDLSRFLMDLPRHWSTSAPTATRSTPKRRASSSKPI